MKRAAGWLALALAGQAIFLRLMVAGPAVGYQHLMPPWRLLDPQLLPVSLLLAFQTIAVTLAWRPLWRPAWRWLRESFPGLRLGAVVAIFVLTAATLSRDPSIYAAELIFAAFLQSLNLATIVLAARALPEQVLGRLRAFFSRILGDPAVPGAPSHARFAVGAGLWVVAAAALLSVFSYERHPHVPDEVVYLLHARYFAEGRMSLPSPPVPAAFDLDLMTREPERWYSPVPPGWPAVLSLGVRLGAPWLVNPILAGIAAVLGYLLFLRLYGSPVARLGTLLLCASPWFIFMGMNFMTHTLALAAALGAGLIVARVREGDGRMWAVAGGAAIGIVALTRPLEGLILALLLGLWILGGARRSRMDRLGGFALLALSTAAVTGLLLPYNRELTGDPLVFPLTAYTDRVHGPGTNAMGFGPDRGLGWFGGLDPLPGHGALDVLVNSNLNLYGLNVELLGWSTGSLLILALFCFSGRLNRVDWWMLAVILSVIGVHALYWFSGGPDFGPRYWYLVLFPCLALAARGLLTLGESLTRLDPGAEVRVLFGGLVLSLMAVVVFWPWRAVDKYHHYRNMRPDIRRLAQERALGASLVLVRGDRHPDYASAAIYNPLDLRARQPIYAWDMGPDVRSALLRAYPDRPVWVVDGPSVTGNGFRIVGGPLSPMEARTAFTRPGGMPAEGSAP